MTQTIKLIPNIFEMSRIRDAIWNTVYFDESMYECQFSFIEVNLHKDIVCMVDATTKCKHENGIIKDSIQITEAVAVDIYNNEFEIDIIGEFKLWYGG